MFKEYFSYTKEDINKYFGGRFEDRHYYREKWFNEWKALGNIVDLPPSSIEQIHRYVRIHQVPYSNYIINRGLSVVAFRHGEDAMSFKLYHDSSGK